MCPHIIFSVHTPVERIKLHKIVLRCGVLESGLCFGVLNGMKGQTIQRKTTIPGIEVSFKIFCDWLEAHKHVKNERT